MFDFIYKDRKASGSNKIKTSCPHEDAIIVASARGSFSHLIKPNLVKRVTICIDFMKLLNG